VLARLQIFHHRINWAPRRPQNAGAPFDSCVKISWNAVWVAETTPGRLPRKWLLMNGCECKYPISMAKEEIHYI